jgi:hypothetical protein
MPAPQLELWSAEPHTTPPVHQQLTPRQRKALIEHLAELILKATQATPNPPSTVTPSKASHER